MTYVPHEDPIHCALCVLESLKVIDYFDRGEDGLYRWTSCSGKDPNGRESPISGLDAEKTISYLNMTFESPPIGIDIYGGKWSNFCYYVSLARTWCPPITHHPAVVDEGGKAPYPNQALLSLLGGNAALGDVLLVNAPFKPDPEVWNAVKLPSDQPSPYSGDGDKDVASLKQRIMELEKDRDDLRNLAESNRVIAESSTRIADRYTDKYKDLRGAAVALLDELSSPFCTPLRQCSEDGCRSVAMWWRHNGICFCDEHRPFVLATITESYYAKSWRSVMSMVKP